MITIKNINEAYGDAITFTEETIEKAVEKMAATISDCGEDFQVSAEDLTEGADYEIVE